MHLNHRVIFERRGVAQSVTGQPLETWTTIADTWARVEPVNGREYFNASGERAKVTHKITLRYGPDLAPRDRAIFGGRIFDIKSVMNLEESNRRLLLMCEETVA